MSRRLAPRDTWVLELALLAGGGARLWRALTDLSVNQADEIYQSLEPAHRLVFGYGFVAWEFVEGARNWTFPLFAAGLLKLAELLGFGAPAAYLLLVRLVFAAIGTAGILATYLLGRSAGGSRLAAGCGALLFALAGLAVHLAPHPASETLSGMLVAFGLAVVARPGGSLPAVVLGCSLCGLATLVRLQSGLFCLGALGLLLSRRAWRQAAVGLATLAGWAVAYGLIDLLTWGHWFQAVAVYLKANLQDNGHGTFLPSTPWFLLEALVTLVPVSGGPSIGLAVAGGLLDPALGLVAAAYLLGHSLISNKEPRYLLPWLPLLFALSGLGVDAARTRWGRRVGAWVAGAAIGLSLAGAGVWLLTGFGEPGETPYLKATRKAYEFSSSINALLLAASGEPDLCGLKVEVRPWFIFGGYTYLHRQVPLYDSEGPPRPSGQFNYVISDDRRVEAGEAVRAASGKLVLKRLSTGPCRSDPNFSYRL